MAGIRDRDVDIRLSGATLNESDQTSSDSDSDHIGVTITTSRSAVGRESPACITSPRSELLWDHGCEKVDAYEGVSSLEEREREWRKFNKTDDDKLIAGKHAVSQGQVNTLSKQTNHSPRRDMCSTMNQSPRSSSELPDLISSMSSCATNRSVSPASSTVSSVSGTPPPLPESDPPSLPPPLPSSSPPILISVGAESSFPNLIVENNDDRPYELSDISTISPIQSNFDHETNSPSPSSDSSEQFESSDESVNVTSSDKASSAITETKQSKFAVNELFYTEGTKADSEFNFINDEQAIEGIPSDNAKVEDNSEGSADEQHANDTQTTFELSVDAEYLSRFGELLEFANRGASGESEDVDPEIEAEFEAILHSLDMNFAEDTYIERFAGRRDRYGFILSPIVERPTPSPSSSISGYSGISSSPDPFCSFRMSPCSLGNKFDMDLSSLQINCSDIDIDPEQSLIPIYRAKKAIVIPEGYGWESEEDILSGSGEWDKTDNGLSSPPVSTLSVAVSQFGRYVRGWKQPDDIIIEEAESSDSESTVGDNESDTESDSTVNDEKSSSEIDSEEGDIENESGNREPSDDDMKKLRDMCDKDEPDSEDGTSTNDELQFSPLDGGLVEVSNLFQIIKPQTKNYDINVSTNVEEYDSITTSPTNSEASGENVEDRESFGEPENVVKLDLSNDAKKERTESTQSMEISDANNETFDEDENDDAEDEYSDTESEKDNVDATSYFRSMLTETMRDKESDAVSVKEILTPRSAIKLVGSMLPQDSDDSDSDTSTYVTDEDSDENYDPNMSSYGSGVRVSQYTSDSDDGKLVKKQQTKPQTGQTPRSTVQVSFRSNSFNSKEDKPKINIRTSINGSPLHIISPLDLSVFDNVHNDKKSPRSPRVFGRYYEEMDQELIEQTKCDEEVEHDECKSNTFSSNFFGRLQYDDQVNEFENSFKHITLVKSPEPVLTDVTDISSNDDSETDSTDSVEAIDQLDSESKSENEYEVENEGQIDKEKGNTVDYGPVNENYTKDSSTQQTTSFNGDKNLNKATLAPNTQDAETKLSTDVHNGAPTKITTQQIKSATQTRKPKSYSPVHIQVGHLERSSSAKIKVKKGFVHELSAMFSKNDEETKRRDDIKIIPPKKDTIDQIAGVQTDVLMPNDNITFIDQPRKQYLNLKNDDIKTESLGFDVTPFERVHTISPLANNHNQLQYIEGDTLDSSEESDEDSTISDDLKEYETQLRLEDEDTNSDDMTGCFEGTSEFIPEANPESQSDTDDNKPHKSPPADNRSTRNLENEGLQPRSMHRKHCNTLSGDDAENSNINDQRNVKQTQPVPSLNATYPLKQSNHSIQALLSNENKQTIMLRKDNVYEKSNTNYSNAVPDRTISDHAFYSKRKEPTNFWLSNSYDDTANEKLFSGDRKDDTPVSRTETTRPDRKPNSEADINNLEHGERTYPDTFNMTTDRTRHDHRNTTDITKNDIPMAPPVHQEITSKQFGNGSRDSGYDQGRTFSSTKCANGKTHAIIKSPITSSTDNGHQCINEMNNLLQAVRTDTQYTPTTDRVQPRSLKRKNDTDLADMVLEKATKSTQEDTELAHVKVSEHPERHIVKPRWHSGKKRKAPQIPLHVEPTSHEKGYVDELLSKFNSPSSSTKIDPRPTQHSNTFLQQEHSAPVLANKRINATERDKFTIQYPASLSRRLYGPYCRIHNQDTPDSGFDSGQREATPFGLLSNAKSTESYRPQFLTGKRSSASRPVDLFGQSCSSVDEVNCDANTNSCIISNRFVNTSSLGDKPTADLNLVSQSAKAHVNWPAVTHHDIKSPFSTTKQHESIAVHSKPITSYKIKEPQLGYIKDNSTLGANPHLVERPSGDRIKTVNRTRQTGYKQTAGSVTHVPVHLEGSVFTDAHKSGECGKLINIKQGGESSRLLEDVNNYNNEGLAERIPRGENSCAETNKDERMEDSTVASRRYISRESVSLGINGAVTGQPTRTINQGQLSKGHHVPENDKSNNNDSEKGPEAGDEGRLERPTSLLAKNPGCQHVLQDEKGNLKLWPYSDFENSDKLPVTLYRARKGIKVRKSTDMLHDKANMTVIQSAQQCSEAPDNRVVKKYHSSTVLPSDESQSLMQTHGESVETVLFRDANGNTLTEEELAHIMPKLASTVANMKEVDAEEILPGITQSVTKLKNGGNLVITTMTRRVDEDDSDSSGRGSPAPHPVLNVDDLENSKIFLVQDSKGELFYVEDVTSETQESAYYSSTSRHNSESVSDGGSSPTSSQKISKLRQIGDSGINESTAEEILSAMYDQPDGGNDGGVREFTENEEEWSERTYEYDFPKRRHDSIPSQANGYSKESFKTAYMVEEPETLPRGKMLTTKDKMDTTYAMSTTSPWVYDGGSGAQNFSMTTQGVVGDGVERVSEVSIIDQNNMRYSQITTSTGNSPSGAITRTTERLTIDTETEDLPLVPVVPQQAMLPLPPICVQTDSPQYSLVKVDVAPKKTASMPLSLPVSEQPKELDDRPIYKTVAHIQTGGKQPSVASEMTEKKYMVVSSSASTNHARDEEVQESHMTVGDLDYKFQSENVEYKMMPAMQHKQVYVRNSTHLDNQERFRTEKRVELGRNNSRLSDQKHKTEIRVRDSPRVAETHQESSYTYDEMRSHLESSDTSMKVVRGSYLIKNNLEEVDSDLDDNINMFDGKFTLSKENPLYQSDEDLYRKLGREKQESAQRQERFQRDFNNDLTFETVDRFTKSKTVKREEERRPKQSLYQMLLSSLSSIESRDIRSTIDVKHHSEDIFGDPRYMHADGSGDSFSSTGTNNFESVGEKVDLLIKEGKAYITVRVTAEKVTPVDLEFNVWRKNQAIVTRTIEIDLLATEQRRRLYYKVMEEPGVRSVMRGGVNETVLDGNQTLDLFAKILGAADGEGDHEDITVKTSSAKTSRPFNSGMDLLY